MTAAEHDITEVSRLAGAVLDEVQRAVVGKRKALTLVLSTVLAGGHVLIEDFPGLGKTLAARSFAQTLGLDFTRAQFTPDLLPSDLTGSFIYDQRESRFDFRPGPIFTGLLLADEINRTPPKTQAALLEAMQERRVTINGEPHAMSPRFTVLATQNPIEQQGVYPLPEAQLDRFLFKLVVDYPDAAEERRIVADHGGRFKSPAVADFGVTKITDAAAIGAAIDAIATVRLAEEVVDYIVRLIRATRASADLECGASPRAATMLARASSAAAALEGRDYVIPDDVQRLAAGVLRHRVILSAAAEIEGRNVEQVIADIVEREDVPR